MSKIHWSARAKKRFRKVLVDTYQSYNLLSIFVSEELDTHLKDLTTTEDLEAVAFHLIDWAESKNRLEDLFQSFCSQNPQHTIAEYMSLYYGKKRDNARKRNDMQASSNSNLYDIPSNAEEESWMESQGRINVALLPEKEITIRPEIKLERKALDQICQEYNIQSLSIFGSSLRSDFNADSDVDLLVKFLPGQTPGLDFIDIQDKLSQLFGQTVDLNTEENLSPYFRGDVLAKAKKIYG